MDLLSVARETTRICNRHETCGDCPLRLYMDLCDALYADEKELEKLEQYEKKLIREAKREEYEEQWKEAKEAADPAPTSSTEPVTLESSPG